MSDQEVRLDTVLTWLEEGKISTEDAVKRVRTMHFPVALRPTSAWDRLMADNSDPEPPEPGSFFAISSAFSAGRINSEQYKALAEAAAQAISTDAASRGGKQ